MIFGSTGSIGKNALSVIRESKGKFKVIGLCANRNINALYSQIKEFHPAYVCVRDENRAGKLKGTLGRGIKLFSGEKGLEEFSSVKSDISLMAISGISSLKPLLISIAHSKRIALANKESIVTAGPLVFKKAGKFNTQIIPVDSEINALFQLIKLRLASGRENDFSRVYLTASGGALNGYRKKELAKVEVRKVLAHPTWSMGKRVTVDSATLVNKGFEVVETHHFFGFPYEKISIVLHKESAIHAFLECRDNTLFACLYSPNMKMPISHALYYPGRLDSEVKENFKNSFSYSFAPANYRNYPMLEIIIEAAKRGDNSLVILNACDEVAIDYFLRKRIKFTDIYKVMAYIFKHYKSGKIKKIDEVFFWDSWARIKTEEYLKKL